jgi:hypothetical protein
MHDVRVDAEDDRLLRAALAAYKPLRALIVGDINATKIYLSVVSTLCTRPLVEHCGEYFVIPPAGIGTLILSNLDALSPVGQCACHNWLSHRGGGVTVISTTTAPLYSLVVRGLFRECLYYRLNMLTITLCPLTDEHAGL